MSCTSKVGPPRKDTIYLVPDGHSYPIARRKQDIILRWEHAVFFFFFKKETLLKPSGIKESLKNPPPK